MKTTWNLAVCLIALLVIATGTAIGNQDQAEGIASFPEAAVKIAGDPVTPTCGALGDPGFLLGQDPHNPGDDFDFMSSHQTSWGTYIMAESIDQVAGPDWFDISSLTVWGFSVVANDGLFTCDPTGMTFDVIFYEENSGEPGAVICDLQSVVPFITNTGVQYSGAGLLLDLYQFDLAAACNLGTVGRKWFTAQNEQHALDCGFVWLSSPDGDGISLQDAGGGWFIKDKDRSMCINGATIPVELMEFSID